MSSFRTVKITCPKCNQESGFTLWDSVNVDLDPEMREKVMDGSLFSWDCPNCKEHFQVPYPFLYHNMTKNFMIQFDPQQSDIVPFAAHLRMLEDDLNTDAVYKLSEQYRKDHEKENILFDCLTDDGKTLRFTVYEMKDYWEKTTRTYEVSYDEYETFVSKEEEKQ